MNIKYLQLVGILFIPQLGLPAMAVGQPLEPQLETQQFTPAQTEQIKKMIAVAVAEATKAAEPTKTPNRTAETPAVQTGSPRTISSPRTGETPQASTTDPTLAPSTGPFDLVFGGYGDIRFAYYDYPESINQNEGSRGQSRAGFDTTRFTFEIEGRHEPLGLEFEAEIEFEHGGTGGAVELEQDEFGEFETEVEKGGEVILEEFYLSKFLGDGYSLKAGRFYVGVGLLSDYYRPTDYLASGRSEAETTIIPGVWDEIGLELEKELSFGRLRLQVVNGLDSTGFGAANWVSSGHQQKFEATRAEDLAYVLRLDTRPVSGLLLGGSSYLAPSTTQNRPKDDLDVDGGLYIFDLHARYLKGPIRTQGSIIWGQLNDAAEISERNARLSNTLGVPRTPVAEEALAAWMEFGYDIAPQIGLSGKNRFEPYVRFDYIDTYFETAGNQIENPRYEREIYTFGLAHTYDDFLTTKLDWTHRSFGTSEIDSENLVRVGLGFIY